MGETTDALDRIAQLERDLAVLYTRVRACEAKQATCGPAVDVLHERVRVCEEKMAPRTWAERYAQRQRTSAANNAARDDAA